MEKMTMTDSTIAFIGLGLIGGSIARAIRKTRPDIRIMAYMRSRSRLEQARKEGIVDVILDGIDENLRECDLIFLCTPVEYNAGYLSAIRPYLKQGALITDVGSTKCGIHEEIRRQGLEYCFVGGHPMAGSEKTGYENSTDHLLENAYYIVTPPEGKNSSRPQALSLNAERIVAVAKTIGAIPLVLDYREHDKVVAA
ncbi:prephenate dehydrogenase, partial [Enterocloster bolteae]